MQKVEMTDELRKLVEEYKLTKKHIDECKAYLDEVGKQLIDHLSVKTEGEEGDESYDLGECKITFGYKLSRAIDEDKAYAIASDLGRYIGDFFNMKLSYSSPKYKALPLDIQEKLVDAITSKPAKTSITIK